MLDKWSRVDIDEMCLRGGGRLLHQGPEGRVVRWGEDGVIASDMEDGPALVAALRKLGLEQAGLFCLRGPAAAYAIQELGLATEQPCTQWVYTAAQPPQLPEMDMRPLTEDYAARCAAIYHPGSDDPSYMLDRIRAGRLWGLFRQGELAAFIGTHHEGSMGILNVLPEYRRQGLASALESWLIGWQLQRGWTPYCHVYADNAASHALQARLGLIPAAEPVIWAWRPEEQA